MSQKYPTDENSMLQISGVGNVKLERYGEPFISAIKEYVEENNINVAQAAKVTAETHSHKSPESVNNTQMASYELAKSGLNIDEIATKRGLARSTVEGHLLSCLQNGLPVDSRLFVTDEMEQQILDTIKLNGFQKLTFLKEALPDEISYAAIRFVIYKNMLNKA